jgi:hypothetical protein
MPEIEKFVIELAKYFSGKENVVLIDRVFDDLGVNGGDFVEFFNEIDEKFQVETRQITEDENGKGVDVTIGEIVNFLAAA